MEKGLAPYWRVDEKYKIEIAVVSFLEHIDQEPQEDSPQSNRPDRLKNKF